MLTEYLILNAVIFSIWQLGTIVFMTLSYGLIDLSPIFFMICSDLQFARGPSFYDKREILGY